MTPAGPTRYDFRQPGFISVWLGDTLTSEDDLDTYLRGQFHSEFGFPIHPADGPEYEVSDVPLDVTDLLQGFSRSSTFADQVADEARLLGWDQATAALVFYNFKYDSDLDRSTDDSPLRFLGVFRYPRHPK